MDTVGAGASGEGGDSMIELYGICGNKIAFNPYSVDYIQDSKMQGIRCTHICFDSGKKIFVDEKYEDVYRMIDDALTTETLE